MALLEPVTRTKAPDPPPHSPTANSATGAHRSWVAGALAGRCTMAFRFSRRIKILPGLSLKPRQARCLRLGRRAGRAVHGRQQRGALDDRHTRNRAQLHDDARRAAHARACAAQASRSDPPADRDCAQINSRHDYLRASCIGRGYGQRISRSPDRPIPERTSPFVGLTGPGWTVHRNVRIHSNSATWSVRCARKH